MPKAPKGNKGKKTVILIEYGWLWLNRDGSPTTLNRELYGARYHPVSRISSGSAYKRSFSPPRQIFWRRGRELAAVHEFCGLGYSRHDGQTSDHWADIAKLTWDPDFYTYVRDAFAPAGIMIDAYDPAHAWQAFVSY